MEFEAGRDRTMAEGLEELVDLHAHTAASDGTLTPRELVEHAAEKGLAAVAVTDHDTTGGVEEALRTGEKLGLWVVPGVELSTELDHREIHIVGLFIDPRDPGLGKLLADRKAERVRRNKKLLELLARLGMPIPAEEVEAAATDGLLTRTHVAEALARHGYADTPVDALERYLIPGTPAWVEKNGPTPGACAQAIHGAGGLAFLAHLDRIDKQDPAHACALALEALDAGLDGLEARYPTYTKEWEDWCDQAAARRGLLRSGGSDFHGSRKRNELGTGFGSLRVPVEWLREMERRVRARRC